MKRYLPALVAVMMTSPETKATLILKKRRSVRAEARVRTTRLATPRLERHQAEKSREKPASCKANGTIIKKLRTLLMARAHATVMMHARRERRMLRSDIDDLATLTKIDVLGLEVELVVCELD